MDLAGIVVSSLSALGSLVQAFYTARIANGKIAKNDIKRAEKRASEPLKIGTKEVDNVIDDQLLTVFYEKLKKHQRNLVEAFRSDDISKAETEVKVEEARAQICTVLSDIMRFNKGQLPTERLKKLSESMNCIKKTIS